MKQAPLKNKNTIDVIYGGQSPEHEISVLSACSIINGLLELDKFIIYPLYISKSGEWQRLEHPLKNKCSIKELKSSKGKTTVFPSVTKTHPYYFHRKGRLSLPDIFFPVLHGKNGEDGSIQGLFKLMDIPFIGCGVLSSAAGMDKDIAKRLFKSDDIPVVPWKCIYKSELKNNINGLKKEIEKDLNYPLFIKPANGGSSIGVFKIKDSASFIKNLKAAFKHESKIIVEKSIAAREIECALLGNDAGITSSLGEILPDAEFYDFKDKYKSGRSKSTIPAKLTLQQAKLIEKYSKKAYKILNCRGLARVDFFICKKTSSIYLNEVNTLPGFTNISMYPKLWEYSGIEFKKLLLKLIDFGIRHYKENKKYGKQLH